LNLKNDDNEEIDILLNTIYKEFDRKNEGDGMYFDEFMRLAEDVTSELFICVYNCIYQYIPCAKNFLIMKENYNKFLKSQKALSKGVVFKPYTYKILMPPITKKLIDQFSETADKGDKKR
jgi:hypothetical protein|tara:strand:- start:2943 stop:3302 length:360 start_codon:yes stop_codon:yes gene_type:complete